MSNFTIFLFHLLFLLIHSIPFLFDPVEANYINGSLVLPLVTQKISPGLRPGPKIQFQHHVSLTVTLQVGKPPQPVSMVLDTGSELSWLHCKKYQNMSSVFEPGRSVYYCPVQCNSATCRTRTRDFRIPVSCDPHNHCHAAVSYVDATTLEGTLAVDAFRVPGFGFRGLVFGCMDTGYSSAPEEDLKITGLLGMNRGSLSFVTQIGYPKFSYCISGQDSSGLLVLGEANFPWLKPLSYTPFVQMSAGLPYFDPTAYSISLEGIKVGSKVLPLSRAILQPDHTGAGQTMIDSGTQFTYLLGPAYTALKQEFMEQTKGILKLLGEPNFVFETGMDLCYRIPLTQRVLPRLPSVTLMFKGAEMTVSTERLLYQVPGQVRGSDSIRCFTFGNSDMLGVEAYLIGSHHQQNMWVEFDLAKSRVGLAQVRCDLATKRLGVGL